MPDLFTVILTPGARRGLTRLPERPAAAVLRFLAGPLAENPTRVSAPLTGDLAGLRSARIGNYRVLFRVEDATGVVRVYRVAHRADAYRPLD